MRLPPQALTAPALCPRCDAPATLPDHCIQCALPLRRCPRCHGVAGPFDRYCGFCGHDMVEGEQRSPAWRLWLLAALVPILAGIAFGLSPYAPTVERRISGLVGVPTVPPPPAGYTAFRSSSLRLVYLLPTGWTASDLGVVSSPVHLPEVLITHVFADQQRLLADGKADLFSATPAGTSIELGRPPPTASPGVDVSDPLAVLRSQVDGLATPPPAGVRVEVVESAHAVTVSGHPAATAVLRLSRGADVRYFQRTWIAFPAGLTRVDALATEADWVAGDRARVQQVIDSIR